jgi:hypothetical protein
MSIKAEIQDPEALDKLNPYDIEIYLRSHGWRETTSLPNEVIVWEYRDEESRKTLLLPRNKEAVVDAEERIRDALRKLAQVEKRSQLAIFTDIAYVTRDVVRFHGTHPDAEDGAIPLKDGVDFYRSVYDMLLFAASSAASPQAYHVGKRPQKAKDYVENTAKIGQSEQGSHVIVLLSQLDFPQNKQLLLFSDHASRQQDPFGRLVVSMLARALLNINRLAESFVDHQGDFEIDDDVADEGVSANLCEAVAKMIKALQNSDLKIEFTWSDTYPNLENLPTRVDISHGLLSTIEQMAEQLKGITIEVGIGIAGAVVGLRGEIGKAGTATIKPFELEDGERTVRLRLDAPEYALASQAHAEGKFIRCTGDLVRRGRSLLMENIEHFAVAEA